MWKYLTLSLLLVFTLSAGVCTEPQKTFYMSFRSLSKRDALPNLFAQIDKKMTPLSSSFSDASISATFKITNVKPQFYYNDHHQTDSYVSKFQAKVVLGVIDVASTFNYSISYSSQTKNGIIKARGFLDPNEFTKNLTMFGGGLGWKPDVVPPLTFSQYFSIERAQPNITEAQWSTITKMINNQAGNVRIKDQIIKEINTYYGSQLEDNLNHEALISSQSIMYKYKNLSFNFQHLAKQFELSNDNTKGLEVFFLFGLDSNVESCTQLPRQFSQKDYGGVQEIFSFSTVRSMLTEAINQKLFDQTLDQSWQTSGFQFYMGDLGNFVEYANYQKANDRFNVACAFDSSKSSALKLSRYDETSLYLMVPLKCTLNYGGKDIIQAQFSMTSNLKLVGEESQIRVVVKTIGAYGGDFKSLDPNYKVTDEYVAKYAIESILKGLVGKTVFGNGFPVLRRIYPALIVLDDRIIVFDPSQV